MKSHTRRRMEVSMVVTALAGCGYLYTLQPDDAPRVRSRALVGELRIAGQLPAAITAAQCLKGGDPALQRLLRERGDKWLGDDRSAEGLIALWDLTRDPALLAEAAEKFPDDPHVCMAMIGQAVNNPTDPMPWIERLIAAQPGNAEGLLLKAWAFGAGDHAGALATLRAAEDLVMSPFTHPDNLQQERLVALRAAADGCGLSSRESALLILNRSRQDSLRRWMMRSVSETLRREMGDQLAVGQAESAVESAGLGLAIADALFFSGVETLSDVSEASGLRRTVLSLLPGDTLMELALSAPSVRELEHQAITASLELANTRRAVTRHEEALLAAATDEEVGEYACNFLQMGEAAAFTWLRDLRAPAPDLPAPHPGP